MTCRKMRAVYVTALCALCLAAGIVAGRLTGKRERDVIVKHRTSTVTSRHTDTLVKVIFFPRYISERAVDSVPCPVVPVHHIRLVQRYYRDSLYEAWVSGYEPRIDSLRVFATRETLRVNTVTVNTVETDWSRWSVGLSAGYGWNGRWSPFVGVTASYALVRFKKKRTAHQ